MIEIDRRRYSSYDCEKSLIVLVVLLLSSWQSLIQKACTVVCVRRGMRIIYKYHSILFSMLARHGIETIFALIPSLNISINRLIPMNEIKILHHLCLLLLTPLML